MLPLRRPPLSLLLRTSLGALAGALLSVSVAGASLLFDNLSYPDGGIVGQGGWAAHSGAGVRPIQIASGQAIVIHGGSGEDVNKLFLGGARPAGATTYACFDVTVTNPGVQTSDEYFAHFKNSTFGFVSRTYTSPPVGAGDFRFAIGATSGAPTYWPSDLNFGQTYRLVISFDGATGTSKLWVDPVVESDPSISNTSASVIGTLIEAFAMRQSSGGAFSHAVDNIRVAGAGQSFADLCDPIEVSIGDAMVSEGNFGQSNLDFTISLDATSGSDVLVCYSTSDGSATLANADYKAVSSTATIPAGMLSTTVSIPVNGDITLEGDETFFVNLCGSTGAAIVDGQGQGTIKNDDGAPSVSIKDISELEGNVGQTSFDFLLVLSNPSDQPVVVDYYTLDGTATLANNDYKAVSATATIPPKTKQITVSVQVNGDTTNEPDETFTVNLGTVIGATVGTGTATGTIENDDAVPCISIDDVFDSEGAFPNKTAFTFTVSLSNAYDQDITVDFATKDGTATLADSDYQATSGTATILAKTLSTTITVLVNGDNILEIGSGKPDFIETFCVNLSNASGGITFCDDKGEGQIQDDEATPALMQRFVSSAGEDGIALTWQFTSAGLFSSVAVERADKTDGPWQVVDVDLSEQDGASVALDRTVEPGTTYFYRLVAEAGTGQMIFGPISVTSLTIEFALSSVYPNPMRELARIDYAVARSAPVKLSVFDIQGREVAVLVDGIQRGGRHQVTWNGRTDGGTANAGVYFVRYQTPGKQFVKRISLTH